MAVLFFHTQIINCNYLYAINAWLLIVPQWLCFDWSMGCVPIINTYMIHVYSALIVALWTVLLLLLAYCLCGRNLQIKR